MIAAKFLKAKPGSIFMETVAETIAHVAQPRLLRFFKLSAAGAHFIVLGSGEELVVDADDRYGRYPALTKKRHQDMLDRKAALEADLARYNHILNKINDLGVAP